MQKALDHAIMLQETKENPGIKSCYYVGDRPYENYLSNNSWATFKTDMEMNHPEAYKLYSLGGGKEMEERIVGKDGNYKYPPKMASFGSSSRMIYNLMKFNKEFLYEKKLPTTVGGIANLDGFIETKEKCVFVEAKCREPYGAKSKEIADKYTPLLDFITKSNNNNLTCNITTKDKGKMEVDFIADLTHIQHFDIKQMICHLLGVATAYLNGKYDKKIDFIYLLYNPTNLLIEPASVREKIFHIHNSECVECESINFNGLFFDILDFLTQTSKFDKKADITKISALFSFRMCDQYTMSV